MDEDKKPDANTGDKPADKSQQAPADALSRTPDDLDEEAKASPDQQKASNPNEKKISPVKKLFRKINIYLLLFILVLVVAGIVVLVTYLNSQKTPPAPDIASQQLSTESLKQLANTDVSVGDKSQTLSIKGNAIIAGQTLIRGGLNVAGDIQAGGSIKAPNITISGTSNLGTAQINSLQVAGTVAIQGSTTMRDLNVAGASTFSGPMTASQITVSRLIMSGNANLEVPNHISFTGPSPSRTITASVLGGGGSASVDGSDTAGTINVNSGNSPVPGCYIRVNFTQQFSRNPHVIVSPVGLSAGQSQFYVERDKTGFSLCSANAMTANKAFAYDYFVTN